MNRRLLLALALTGLLAAPGGSVRSEGIVADLSSHLVAISSGFTGTSVVLFGAIDGGGLIADDWPYRRCLDEKWNVHAVGFRRCNIAFTWGPVLGRCVSRSE